MKKYISYKILLILCLSSFFYACSPTRYVGKDEYLLHRVKVRNEEKNINTPELKNPSEELTALAEQIRTVLEKFSPSDPAVTALKQSEAYQKVAYLIEGIAPPIVGGLSQ